MWSWKSDGNVLSTQQRLLTGNNEQDMMIHDENWDLTKSEAFFSFERKKLLKMIFWDEGLHGNYFDLAKREFGNTPNHWIWPLIPLSTRIDAWTSRVSLSRRKNKQQHTVTQLSMITNHHSHLSKEYRNVLMNQTKLNGLWMDCCFWLFLVTIIACSTNLAIRYTHHIPTECNVIIIVCRFGIFTNIQE